MVWITSPLKQLIQVAFSRNVTPLNSSIKHTPRLGAKKQASLWGGNAQAPMIKSSKKGQVIFVGAGAGDPELLTIKAVKALNQADVVLIDWLVNPEINTLIPDHVERIFVGKKCGQHSMKQAQITELLLEQVQLGKTVVRLKGGDPSIFARLPEETDVLEKHDIPFQVIPGVTAASGCAAYSGIPLTHRDCAQSVKFVTAHLKNEQEECQWELLAKEQGTLVFYMGLNRVALIAERLITNGMSPDVPIAIIDQGTGENQQVCTRTLQSIDATTDLASFTGPALIIVGEVVNKRVKVNTKLTDTTLDDTRFSDIVQQAESEYSDRQVA